MKLVKSLVILFLSSFIGITLNAEMPFASDTVAITDINNDSIYHTISTEKASVENPVETLVENAAPDTAENFDDGYSEEVYYEESYEEEDYNEESEPEIPYYYVTSYVGSASEFNEIAHSLSYSDLYKYKKMIYGHNSYNLLGTLAYRYVGETIAIVDGGATNYYVVSDIQMYEKTDDGGLNGDPKLMTKIAKTALGHDLALLTCAGTSYGNGDASHRLVVFVDAA